MRVAIIGSRVVSGVTAEDIIEKIPQNCSEIVSGGARGIDTLAAEAARLLALHLRTFRPDYAAFGKRAPIVRNDAILGNCDYVLAFWDYASPGTKYVIGECIRRHIPCKIIELGPDGIVEPRGLHTGNSGITAKLD